MSDAPEEEYTVRVDYDTRRIEQSRYWSKPQHSISGRSVRKRRPLGVAGDVWACEPRLREDSNHPGEGLV